MNEQLPRIGEFIRSRRTAIGLTQVELAEAIEMSQRWVSMVERGQINLPRRETMHLLAKLFDLPIEELYMAAGLASTADGARKLHDTLDPMEIRDPNAIIMDLVRHVDLSDQERYDSLLSDLTRWLRQDRKRSAPH